MRALVLAVCCVSLPAWAVPASRCGPAIVAAEKARGTAPGLLAAIGQIESGRLDPQTRVRTPWPWTVTAEGVGTFYPGKEEAIAAVTALRARGVISVDVGCMQVNLAQHAAAFRDLDEAFDPAANALFAAQFLSSLRTRLGDWALAAAAYHSLTPILGARYGQLVMAVWSGAAVAAPGTPEVVRFPDGGMMRIFHDEVAGSHRIAGYLSGP